MFDQIVLFSSCVADISIAYLFFSGFFKKRYEMFFYRTVAISIGFILLFFAVNLAGSANLNLMLIPILMFAYCCWIFRGKIVYKCMCFLMTLATIMGAEFIFVVITEKSLQTANLEPEIAVLAVLITKLMSFVILLVLRQLLGSQKNKMVNKVFWLYLLLPVASIGMMVAAYNVGAPVLENNAVKETLTVLFLCMLFANILVFAAFQSYSDELTRSLQKEYLASKEIANQQYYAKVSEMNEERKALVHDIKHYISGLRGLIIARENEKAVQYLSEIDQRLNSTELMVFSQMPVLDAILTEKKNIAEAVGIQCMIRVDARAGLEKIPEKEYVAMLGNLSDNAIRGAEACIDDKKMSIEIYEINNGSNLVTKISNSFIKDAVKQENGVFLTTKKNKGMHGVGLKNVKRTADQLEGIFSIETEGNQFVAILVLPIE